VPVTPASRIRVLNDAAVRPSGAFVLYWMTAARRPHFNFGLQRAMETAAELNRPLVVLEALRCDYRWASDRLHRFVLDGMAANATAFAGRPLLYYPYVEPPPEAGRGLLAALAERACAVVTDWYPAFFLPRMSQAAAQQVSVRLEAIDSNGIIPVAEHGRPFPTARGYRAFLQRVLKDHVRHVPDEDPVQALQSVPALRALPDEIVVRWPAASPSLLNGGTAALDALPIDHLVKPAAMRGGGVAARLTLRHFVTGKLARYGEDHNHPDLDATSRLSPYLHFGHISAHEVFGAIMTHERWTTRRLAGGAAGAREGWWGVSPSAEMFLDQLVVWREVAFNGCAWTRDFTGYDTLPAWARQTLETHESDPRPHRYSLEALDAAATHDEVWNAAQRQLKAEGWFHGYMRMLWGKKILEWSDRPREALSRMEHLMNRYSLDGRDPVSYASFGWVLGRYDRPWPERPVFGTVRSMTSASAKRKLKMKAYLEKYGPQAAGSDRLF
jgi:deoxyribodipyrimidine photo-lyase